MPHIPAGIRAMQDTSVPEAPQVHSLHSILLAPPQGIFFTAQGVVCTPICSAATVRALCTRPSTGETALLPRVVQHTGSGCSLLLERSHLQPCMFFQVLRWRVEARTAEEEGCCSKGSKARGRFQLCNPSHLPGLSLARRSQPCSHLP